jgi:hypothetical protein
MRRSSNARESDVTPLWLLIQLSGSALSAPLALNELADGEGLYVRYNPRTAWGTPLLIETIEKVAADMAWLYPRHEPLLVGDMSGRYGGSLYGHRTHKRGVDADIGLYRVGGIQPLDGFVDLSPHVLDLDANLMLIRTLLSTGDVSYILLDQRHIWALRVHALAQGYPREWVDDVLPARLTPLNFQDHGVVRHAPNHRSHLHVHVRRGAEVL